MMRNNDDRQNKFKTTSKLTLAVAILASLFNCTSARSQITPDDTLGDENSTVTPNAEVKGAPAELIEGGAAREANLFHSFEEFNIGDGQNVYFTNPVGIANIFSRVTGNDVSDIFGTLGVDGGADLFLINPNGIIFGENASLDVNGSFLATSASEIQFGDRGEFSATDPNALPILTVQPSALLFNQMQPGRIESRSTVPVGTSTSGNSAHFGLNVPDGESLSLIGGEVAIDGGGDLGEGFGGGLTAPNGRIELMGVTGEENIELNQNGDSFSVNLAPQVQSADLVLGNRAFVDTSGESGGAIYIQGRNVTLSDRSLVFADTLGSQNGSGVSIKAKNLTFDRNSGVTADLVGSGQGGNIDIETEQLIVRDRAFLSTSNYGRGNAGNVKIDAVNFSVDRSSIATLVSNTAIGDAGNIKISISSFSTTGSILDSSNYGQGNAGNVKIDAIKDLAVDNNSSIRSILGSSIEGSSSGGIDLKAASVSISNNAELNSSLTSGGKGNAGNIKIEAGSVVFDGGFARSRLEKGAEGSGGDIRIDTGSLLVTGVDPITADANVGQLVTATFGEGDAGRVIINASEDVSFDGRGSDVFSLVGFDRGIGKGGSITINSKSLSVDNGARLIAGTEASGEAGDIVIDTDSFSVTNGGQLGTNTENDPEDNIPGVEIEKTGGNIDITTKSFVAASGGALTSGTLSSGNAGRITVKASESVLLDGAKIIDDRTQPSGIFTRVEDGSAGQGGDIDIITKSFSAIDGGQLNANTSGEGNAGNIRITATDTVSFARITTPTSGDFINSDSRSGAFTTSEQNSAIGDGGNITIETGQLLLKDEAAIEANTFRQGNGGNINLQVQDLVLLRNNSNISTNAGIEGAGGAGGNIDIQTDVLAAISQENSDITANAFEGRGGFIKIAAEGIFGLEARAQLTDLSDITAFSQQNPQLDGTVEIITFEVNQSPGLLQLPDNPVSTKVVQVCESGDSQQKSELVVTGRSGLPDSPEANLNGGFVLEDWRVSQSSSGAARRSPKDVPQKDRNHTEPIVEADSWRVNQQGKVVLVAANQTETSSNLDSSADCPSD